MKISDSIKYVGVNDHEIDLFEDSLKFLWEWHITPM